MAANAIASAAIGEHVRGIGQQRKAVQDDAPTTSAMRRPTSGTNAQCSERSLVVAGKAGHCPALIAQPSCAAEPDRLLSSHRIGSAEAMSIT